MTVTALSSSSIKLDWEDNSVEEISYHVERKIGTGGIYSEIASPAANTITMTDNGLTQSTTYYYRVRCYTGGGYSTYSNEAFTSTLPATPMTPVATATSTTAISLSWTDASASETGFAIERKTGSSGTYVQVATVAANATSYVDSGLSEGTSYYYRVRAYSGSVFSAYSIEANTITLPATPTTPVATATSTSAITLTWTDASASETGFAIERKTGSGGTYVQVTTVAANTTSYANSGLSEGTSYYYRMRAYCGSVYSAYSNEISITTPTLIAPSWLTATATSSAAVNLSWTDNSTDETNFSLERKIGVGGTYSAIVNPSANVVTYSNTGLSPEITYYYRIRAYNGAGYSAYSSEVSVTTLTFNAPLGLTATASSTSVSLFWTDSTTDETNFSLERKIGVGGTYSAIVNPSANVVTYTNTGLSPEITYYYRIRAYNGAGYYSAYSDEVSVTTLTFNAPSGLTATASSTSVSLFWTDNTTDEMYFSLERKIGVGGAYSAIVNPSANVVTYTNTYLSPETTYYFRIRAYNQSGYSAYSDEVIVTTLTFNAPSAFTATATSSRSISLSWIDNSTNETSFQIERKIGIGGTYGGFSAPDNTTTYTDDYLLPETTYYYRIRAYNETGYSAYSNEVSVTTLTLNAPSGLTATATSTTSVSLSWTDNSTDETSFSLERKIGAEGTFATVQSMGANTSSSFNVGLKNTCYYYRIRAFNGTGYSSYSNEVSVTTPALNAPSFLAATATSSTTVSLSWDDNSTEEIVFIIERKTGEEGIYTEVAGRGANTTSYVSVGMNEGTCYYYRIRVYDGTGHYSLYSNEVSVTTPPVAPISLGAAASFDAITVTWTDISSTETGFAIERKTGAGGYYVQIASEEANVSSFTDTDINLTTASSYFYRVRAYSGSIYSGYSIETNITTLPAAPTQLVAQASQSTIALSWTDTSVGESGFAIERKSYTGTYVQIATVAANVTNFVDSGVIKDVVYGYRVRAYGGSLYSYYSAEVNAFTLEINAPSNLTATATSSSAVNLHWTDNSTNEFRFYIEQKVGEEGAFTIIAAPWANETGYTHTDLLPETTYYYRVKASTMNGDSSTYSNEVSVTTLPPTPTALSVSSISPISVNLTWTDASASETGFSIERKTGAGGAYSQIATVLSNVNAFTDNGVVGGTLYYYRVRAFNNSLNSLYSAEVSITTQSQTSPPTGLTAIALSSASIKLDWEDNSTDEISYHVERKAGVNGTYGEIAVAAANAITLNDNGLMQSSVYYYRVRCYTGVGYSTYSNEMTITTPLATPTALIATATSSTTITLTWGDTSTSETGFAIERKSSESGIYNQVAIVATNATSYNDSDLSADIAYTYRIRAYNGSLYSNYTSEATATPPAATLAPSDLIAMVISPSKVNLTWTDNSPDETYFYLERKLGAEGTYAQITSRSANSMTYSNTGLTQETTYYYRIRAFNGTGYSAYSNEISITTPDLSAPSTLTATAVALGQIKLSWPDSTDYETSYLIERKISTVGNYAQIMNVVADVITYTNTGMEESDLSSISYRVRAFDGVNYSPYAVTEQISRVVISSVATDSTILNTDAGEAASIQYSIDGPATVTLKIIPEKLGLTGTPIYQTAQVVPAAGIYSFSWNGKDSTGKVVPDEAYYPVVEAVQGGIVGWYLPSEPAIPATISCSQGDDYDAYRNRFLSIDYSLSKPAMVALAINYPDKWNGQLTQSILYDYSNDAGLNTFVWNGRRDANKIALAGGVARCNVIATLRENVIIARGDTPRLSDLSADPYAVDLSFGEFATIKYSLAQATNISISLVPNSGGTTLQIMPTTLMTAGPHELVWNALDATDSSGKKFVVSTEGYYTVTIQATNPTTGTSSVVRGSLKIGR